MLQTMVRIVRKGGVSKGRIFGSPKADHTGKGEDEDTVNTSFDAGQALEKCLLAIVFIRFTFD